MCRASRTFLSGEGGLSARPLGQRDAQMASGPLRPTKRLQLNTESGKILFPEWIIEHLIECRRIRVRQIRLATNGQHFGPGVGGLRDECQMIEKRSVNSARASVDIQFLITPRIF